MSSVPPGCSLLSPVSTEARFCRWCAWGLMLAPPYWRVYHYVSPVAQSAGWDIHLDYWLAGCRAFAWRVPVCM